METVFTIANFSVVPFWLLLIFFPQHRWTRHLVHSGFLFGLLAIAYAALLFTDMGQGGEGSMFSLGGVMAIFDRPQTVVAAWIHYLIFDLFVAAFMVRDARALGIRHAYIVPGLGLTLFFGPVGLLYYLVLRGALRRRFHFTGSTGADGIPS